VAGFEPFPPDAALAELARSVLGPNAPSVLAPNAPRGPQVLLLLSTLLLWPAVHR